MTEELNKEEEGKETPAEKETVAEQEKTEKFFSQKDVDEIVKGRVAREKDLTSRVQDAFDSFRKDTDTLIGEYESHIKLQLDNLLATIPDNIKSILGKLPVLEQLEWLTDPKNQTDSRTSPKTPKALLDEKVDEKEKIKPLF